MLYDVVLLLGGLALIIKGGDWFVAAAVRIAGFLRMPRVVIGSTLVSLATTSPELVVSITAGAKGQPGLAVGNAIGSCICNIGLILGVTAALKHVDVHPRVLRTPLVAMFLAGAVLFLMTMNLSLSRWQGIVLLLGGTAYFTWDFWQHWRDRKPRDLAEAGAIRQAMEATRWAWLHTRAGACVQFAAGAAVVIFGSRLLVDGAVNVALRLGIPAMVVGLTVVAVGTSLPELVTAITSSRQSVSDLTVGNVLGANIANLTFIVGTAAVLQKVTLSRLSQMFNFTALLAMMALLVWVLLTDRRVTRREGVVLLGAYGVYLASVILLTVWVRL